MLDMYEQYGISTTVWYCTCTYGAVPTLDSQRGMRRRGDGVTPSQDGETPRKGLSMTGSGGL